MLVKFAVEGKDLKFRLDHYRNCQGYIIDGYNMTLLHYAVKNQLVESVNILLNLDLDPNDRQMYGSQTPLFLATGISVNSTCNNETVNSYLITQLLINYGADVNIVDYKGMTPLMYAANGQHDLELIRLLLDAGADATLKMNDGRTALYFALRKNPKGNDLDRIEIIKLLLSHGGDPNLVNGLDL